MSWRGTLEKCLLNTMRKTIHDFPTSRYDQLLCFGGIERVAAVVAWTVFHEREQCFRLAHCSENTFRHPQIFYNICPTKIVNLADAATLKSRKIPQQLSST